MTTVRTDGQATAFYRRAQVIAGTRPVFGRGLPRRTMESILTADVQAKGEVMELFPGRPKTDRVAWFEDGSAIRFNADIADADGNKMWRGFTVVDEEDAEVLAYCNRFFDIYDRWGEDRGFEGDRGYGTRFVPAGIPGRRFLQPAGGTPLTDAGTVDHAAVDMASRRSTPADDVYPHTVRAAEDEELLDQWAQY